MKKEEVYESVLNYLNDSDCEAIGGYDTKKKLLCGYKRRENGLHLSTFVKFPGREDLYPYSTAVRDFLSEKGLDIPSRPYGEYLRSKGLYYEFLDFRFNGLVHRFEEWTMAYGI